MKWASDAFVYYSCKNPGKNLVVIWINMLLKGSYEESGFLPNVTGENVYFYVECVHSTLLVHEDKAVNGILTSNHNNHR